MTLQRGRDAAGDPGRYAGRRADDSWLDLAPARATDDLEDPWAWADRDADGRSLPDTSTVEVTAVLVTLDAERWLPETLAALAGLQRRPDRLVAIDNGSADGTRTAGGGAPPPPTTTRPWPGRWSSPSSRPWPRAPWRSSPAGSASGSGSP